MKLKRRMTPDEFYVAMLAIEESDHDTERAHGEADDMMCELLERFGYGKGIEVYRKMERWYA